jgi:spore coat polysaccharide biosynthesis protein SpsF
MLPIWRDMPLIEMVLRRVASARLLSQVVLATPTTERDDPLVEVAERLRVPVFRGPEDDVLARFVGALDAHRTDAIVRVCGDNPFVDPRAIDDLVRFFQQNQPLDYASNHTPRSGLPDGFGGEIIWARTLREVAARARSAFDREHVTAYVWSRSDEFLTAYTPPPLVDRSRIKLDIDSEADLTAMRRLVSRLPDDRAPLWNQQTIVEAVAA